MRHGCGWHMPLSNKFAASTGGNCGVGRFSDKTPGWSEGHGLRCTGVWPQNVAAPFLWATPTMHHLRTPSPLTWAKIFRACSGSSNSPYTIPLATVQIRGSGGVCRRCPALSSEVTTPLSRFNSCQPTLCPARPRVLPLLPLGATTPSRYSSRATPTCYAP